MPLRTLVSIRALMRWGPLRQCLMKYLLWLNVVIVLCMVELHSLGILLRACVIPRFWLFFLNVVPTVTGRLPLPVNLMILLVLEIGLEALVIRGVLVCRVTR